MRNKFALSENHLLCLNFGG